MSTSHYCFICKKTRDVTTKMPQNHNELSVWLARLQLQVPVHLYDYYRNYYICEQHFTPGSLSSTTRRPPSLQPLPPSTSNVFAQNSLNVALSSSSTHSNRTTMPATSPKIVRLIRCTPIVAPMLSQTSAANQVSNPTRVQILTTPRQMPSLLLTQSNVENEPMETGTDVEENSSEEDESAVDDDLNEEDQEVAEEELPANDKFSLVQNSQFQSWKFCPMCGQKLRRCQHRASFIGTCPVVHCHSKTPKCNGKWYGQSNSIGNESRDAKIGNLAVATGCYVNDIGYPKWRGFCNSIGLSTYSERTYYRVVSSLVVPAIDEVYELHRENWLTKVREVAGTERDLHLAGDGQYDSRGYSALICKYVLMCASTKLIVGFSIQHKNLQPANVSSNELEILGFVDTLAKVENDLWTPTSITTDKNRRIIQQVNNRLIEHKLDPWHFIKNLRNTLRKLAKQRVAYRPLEQWNHELTNHAYFCLTEYHEDPDLLRQRFTSCLHHVIDQHEWSDDPFLPDISECVHADDAHNPNIEFLNQNSEAYERLKTLIQSNELQQDLMKLSPRFTTEYVESFFSNCLLYTSKERYFNYKSYVSKTKLAILHRNEMMLEDRPVLRQKAYVNRATKRQNFRNVRKTPKKLWKREIVEKVLELRRDGRAIVVNAAEFEEDDSENEEPTDNRNARETDENDSDDDEELYL